MYNEPIILFLVLTNLPFTHNDINGFKKLLVFLLSFEVIIGILQVPLYLATGASEKIRGTFHHNAEQYGAFILMGVFYAIGKRHISTQGRALYNLMIIGILILILMIDKMRNKILRNLTHKQYLSTTGKIKT